MERAPTFRSRSAYNAKKTSKKFDINAKTFLQTEGRSLRILTEVIRYFDNINRGLGELTKSRNQNFTAGRNDAESI